MTQILFILFITGVNHLYPSAADAHKAAQNGMLKTLMKLLTQQPNLLEKKAGHFQVTPLLAAVQGLQTSAVEFLLKKGANIHANDEHQRNGLHLLAMYGSTKLSQVYLLPNEKQKIHNTIVGIGRLLIQAGISLTQKNTNQRTPLDIATQNYCYPLFSLFKAENISITQCLPNTFYTTCPSPDIQAQAVATLLTLGVRPYEGYLQTPLLTIALKDAAIQVARLLLLANAPIDDDGLKLLVNNYKSDDLFITAFACFQLYDRRKNVANITKMVTPEELSLLQPQVKQRKTELLTNPVYDWFLLNERIKATKLGLTLTQLFDIKK